MVTMVSQPLEDHLLTLYDALWRKYHDRNHFVDVTKNIHALGLIQGLVTPFPWELDKAIKLHDVIYRPGLPGSEEASALLAESAGYGFEVARLIRLTEKHNPEPDDIPGILICNADLLGLASGPIVYKRNTDCIQFEYRNFPRLNLEGDIPLSTFMAMWRTGRSEWINTFLDREAIFLGPGMDQFEKIARDNLINELKLYEVERAL